MKRTLLSVTAAAATLPLAVAMSPVQAAPSATKAAGPDARVTAGGLLSPLSLYVTGNRTRYVSENFKGTLLRQRPGHKPTAIFQSKGGAEVGAVSVRNGVVTFGVTGNGTSSLKRIDRRGRVHTVANLHRYEKRHNPDGKITYGFQGLSASCLASLPQGVPGPYKGIVDSHPYATISTHAGTYIADAATNTILRLDHRNRLHTVAVMPAVTIRVTSAMAAAAHMPACLAGHKIKLEFVPTDVEVAPNGDLVVSSLPGGPEDGSLGAQGSVWRINPHNGRMHRIAKGLVSPVGVAVGRNGDVYVSQLFANVVSRIPRGTHHAQPWRHLAMPGDVERSGGAIFATGNVLTGSSGNPGDVPRGTVNRVR
jgi:hypothetical protein